jgi:hypothetical protein
LQDEPVEAEDEPEADDDPEVPEVEDEPTEVERAGTLGAISTQDLQPEMQSSTSTQDVPFERMLVFNNPILSDKPLKNELGRLMRCKNLLSKEHEHKVCFFFIMYVI